MAIPAAVGEATMTPAVDEGGMTMVVDPGMTREMPYSGGGYGTPAGKVGTGVALLGGMVTTYADADGCSVVNVVDSAGMIKVIMGELLTAPAVEGTGTMVVMVVEGPLTTTVYAVMAAGVEETADATDAEDSIDAVGPAGMKVVT